MSFLLVIFSTKPSIQKHQKQIVNTLSLHKTIQLQIQPIQYIFPFISNYIRFTWNPFHRIITMLYPPPYSQPDFIPPSSTRINHQQSKNFIPEPYIAEPVGNVPSFIPNQANPFKCLSSVICIILILASIFYTIVLFVELGKLPCRSEIYPIIILGAIASIGLTLMGIFSLGFLSMKCISLYKVLVYLTSIISLLGAVGFLIYVWVMQHRHIGVCYIRANFAPILIALGFLQAGVALIVPSTLKYP